MKDHRLVEDRGEIFAAVLPFFHDFKKKPLFFKGFREHERRVATAHDENSLGRGHVLTEKTQDISNVLGFGQDKKVIVLLENRFSRGNDGFPVPGDGSHQEILGAAAVLDVPELFSQGFALSVDVKGGELDPSLGEIDDFRRARKFHEADDTRHRFPFRVDAKIDAQVTFVENLRVSVEIGIPDTGDFQDRPGLDGGKKAGDDVRFVAVRDGDDHVRLVKAHFFQDVGAAAAALEGLDVDVFRHLLEALLVPVDDDDIVALPGQDVRYVVSHFPGADDDNSHGRSLVVIDEREWRTPFPPPLSAGSAQPGFHPGDPPGGRCR